MTKRDTLQYICQNFKRVVGIESEESTIQSKDIYMYIGYLPAWRYTDQPRPPNDVSIFFVYSVALSFLSIQIWRTRELQAQKVTLKNLLREIRITLNEGSIWPKTSFMWQK